MSDSPLDRDVFRITRIGECKIDSPLNGTSVHFTSDEDAVLLDKTFGGLQDHFKTSEKIYGFEEAGPREKIFHDPRWSKAAILTAGGLCPGLNSVIKGLT